MQTNKKHHLFAHYRAFFIVLLMILSGPLVAQDTQINITVAAGETFSLPVADDPTNSFSIDWGDGTFTTGTNDVAHVYQTAGEYTLSVTGTFAGIDWDTFVTEGATEPFIAEIGNFDVPELEYFCEYNCNEHVDDYYIVIDENNENDYHIDWGDGTIDLNVSKNRLDHKYNTTGRASDTLSIYGYIPHFSIANSGAASDPTGHSNGTEISIVQWGNQVWKSLEGMFYGTSIVVLDAQDVPDLSQGPSMENMLHDVRRNYLDFSNWVSSEVQNMNRTFFHNSQFEKQYYNISDLDVDGVEDFTAMLNFTHGFDEDLSSWNPVSVTASENWCAGTTGWSTENFEATLLGWIDNTDYHYNQSLLHNIFHGYFGGGGRQICSDEAVRAAVKHAGLFADSPVLGDDGTPVNWAEDCREGVQFVYTVTAGESITLPVITDATNDFTVMWGDKVVDLATDIDQTGDISHTYTEAGTYTVHIVGDFSGMDWDRVTRFPDEAYRADAGDFVMTIAVPAGDLTVKSPENSGYVLDTYDFDIYWGDGSYNYDVDGNGVTHTYPAAGEYQVRISGSLPHFIAKHADLEDKLLSVDQWGSNAWKSMRSTFSNCQHMQVLATDLPDLSQVTDFEATFQTCLALTGGISQWDVSHGKTFDAMLASSSLSESLADWDISQAESMFLFAAGVDFTTDQYDEMLMAWSQLDFARSVKMDISAQYCSQEAHAARQSVQEQINLTDQGRMYGCAPFITTWSFSEDMPTLTLYHSNGYEGAYDYEIDWGDGRIENYGAEDDEAAHTYGQAGTYDVSITGTYPHFDRSSLDQNENLIAVKQWGDIEWKSFADAFSLCTNLDIEAEDTPDLSQVSDFSYAFTECSSLTGGLKDWQFEQSSINLTHFLRGAVAFDEDLSGWDISKVGTIGIIFSSNSSGLPTAWSTDNVDATLIGWAKQDIIFSSLEIWDAEYCSYEAHLAVEQIRAKTRGNDVQITRSDCDQPFIMTFEVAPGQTLAIPTNLSHVYDYTIQWGDGTVDLNVTGDISHTYANTTTQPYQVRISGDFPAIYFNDSGDKDALISVDQWGNISWKTFLKAFWGCTNMEVGEFAGVPNLAHVTSMKRAFQSCNRLIGTSMSAWDVSTIDNMDHAFQNAWAFNADLTGWATHSLSRAVRTFKKASSFDQDLGGWDFSNLSNAEGMLDNSGLSTENYDNLISGLPQQSLTVNLELGANGLTYCESAGDRGFLIDVLGWQFTGDESDCSGQQQAARSATHQANQVENLEQQTKELVIYPNPASEVLRVNTPADFEVVRIYNLSGILVKSTKASEIDISALKTGLYLLVIEFKDESEQVLKFVKE